MLSVSSNTDEQVVITASPTTAPPASRPATFDGPLRLTLISGNATFLQDPALPNEFKVVSEDAAGQSIFRVDGDADLGAGVTLISETVEYTYASAQAANFGLVAARVEPKAGGGAGPA